MRSPFALFGVSVACLAPFAAACGDESPPPPMDGGSELGVHPRFDPVAGPMPLGAIPWPDDLYLDEEGRIAVGELPGESADPAYHASLREGLHDLDGFGVVSPVFFTFDGPLDPSSLPGSSADSMLEGASVFLVDVDPASPHGFSRLPIDVSYHAPRGELALRPAVGHPLRAQGRYAAVVTRRVTDEAGAPLVPDPDFEAVRDALTMPSDPLLAHAHDEYTPVLATLASNGVEREDVVALAVFRTASIGRELLDARTRVYELDAPRATVSAVIAQGPALDEALGTPAMDLPGLDVEGGVRHGSIGCLLHGTFESPWMISSEPFTHGRFERDAMGRIEVKRMEEVPFTLVLPQRTDLSALPLVVFQHGIGEERSNVLAFADVLAADGFAVVAIDAPFHGLRNPSPELDRTNAFTGRESPDGFGDVKGLDVVITFAGITDTAGELVPFHPIYLRDALRQSVVDLYTLVRLLTEGDLSEIRAALPELASLGFADAPMAFIGNSLGGIIGTELVATEPEIGAAVLSVTGGSIMEIVVESPTFNRGYLPLLLPRLGIAPPSIDYEAHHPRFFPELAIWQTLLDRGDAIAYADLLRERPIDVLMLMARHDETLNNVGTEGLARALGLPLLGGAPLHSDLSLAEAPLRNNATASGEMVSRGLYVHEPATHGLILERHGRSVWAHPLVAPFAAGTAVDIDNPIDQVLAQVLHFFESSRAGEAEIVGPVI